MTTWEKVMALRKNDKRSRGCANTLTRDEINTILATLDWFGEEPRQAMFDLSVCRYRVFDWLAMGIQGRIQSKDACKVLTYSFLKCEGDIDRFVEDLRVTDYDIGRSEWHELELTV